jgi:hypothetical protein
VFVLCGRAEDNAGNVGIGMATVYNGYETLAKTVAMIYGAQ